MRRREWKKGEGERNALDEFSINTPRYTVTNCLGSEKKAASANVKTPMPHVENTAVVTTPSHHMPSNISQHSPPTHTKRERKEEGREREDERGEEGGYAQCPGIALNRAINAILNPPSLTTCARHPY